jgi:uncharacterized protein YigA (DUF484 family)
MSQEQGPITRNPAGGIPSSRPEVDESRVAHFLRSHPDFLLRHADLLRVLTPPAQNNGGNVEDFQTFLIERLRAEVERLQGDNRDLLITSRDNLSGQRRVHESVLALVTAPDFEQLVHVITTDLAIILDLDIVTLCVEVADTKWPRSVASGVFTLQPGAVDELVGSGRDYILYRRRPGERAVFGGATGLVRSSALLRLRFGANGKAGILALGSRNDDTFHPGQGTELLSFLARVVEMCVKAWLDLPE